MIRREVLDDYDNQYVRKLSGPAKVRYDESDKKVEIGRIELWYIDGSRAQDDGLDIADVCDSLGQAEADYATAVYSGGSIDSSIVENAFSNDVLVVHSLSLQPKYHGQRMETHVIDKIAVTIGYHCAAVVLIPERVGITDNDDLELAATKNPSIYCLADF